MLEKGVQTQPNQGQGGLSSYGEKKRVLHETRTSLKGTNLVGFVTYKQPYNFPSYAKSMLSELVQRYQKDHQQHHERRGDHFHPRAPEWGTKACS
jgi:hypothetical protein